MAQQKIAVLVSGGGTNLGALIMAEQAGKLKSGKLSLVLSSSPTAYALERAKIAGIKHAVVSRKEPDFEAQILALLEENKIDIIVLAGFMYVLSADFVGRFPKRIINIHPSLIPSFCGDGFYGLRVHDAVLKAGVKVTGATVHFVNEITDGGEIIDQKAVRVCGKDTPETLQKRVMVQAEQVLLPRAVEKVCAMQLKSQSKQA